MVANPKHSIFTLDADVDIRRQNFWKTSRDSDTEIDCHSIFDFLGRSCCNFVSNRFLFIGGEEIVSEGEFFLQN